jgi:hypothetical protein
MIEPSMPAPTLADDDQLLTCARSFVDRVEANRSDPGLEEELGSLRATPLALRRLADAVEQALNQQQRP